MKSFVVWLVLICFIKDVVSNELPMAHYFVDLDIDSPANMWRKTMYAMLLDHDWDTSFGPAFADIKQIYILGGCDSSCIQILASSFKQRFPNQGISETLKDFGHEVSIEELASFQYFYEVGHARPPSGETNEHIGCSSIVACNTDGHIVHGRNLDFHQENYRNITAQITWRRNGAALFQTTQFIGEDVGVATGVRKGKFSFSYNWRVSKEPLKEILDCIKDPSSAAPLGSFVRELFENGTTFSEAAYLIENSRICGPAYAIVAGPSGTQGVVFTRNHTTSLYPNWIQGCTPGQRWFVAQANYDHWLPQPPADDRLELAINALNAKGQVDAATMKGIWEVLSTPGNGTSRGVLNQDTLYTSILNPATGEIINAIR